MTARDDGAFDAAYFTEWSLRSMRAKRSLARAGTIARAVGALPCLVPVVTVVGSKGKGTAAAACASVLHASGLTVGLVSSPPYRSNTERVRYNGCSISEGALRELGDELAAAAEAIPCAEDEYLSPTGAFTVMGAAYLQRRGVDVLVLEEGMGGLSDEVSLFDPSVLAVTPIFLEHQGILGETIAEIATDLIGVTSPATRWVLSAEQPSDVGNILEQAARRAGADVEFLPVSSQFEEARTRLIARNMHLGARAAELAGPLHGWNVTADAITRGLERLKLPGRMTEIRPSVDRTWVVDSAVSAAGAHNALEYFERAIGEPDVVILCLPDDKDIDGSMAVLQGQHVRPVILGTSHLSFSASKWGAALEPWERVVREESAQSSRVLCLGTISFVGGILEYFDVSTDCVF